MKRRSKSEVRKGRLDHSIQRAEERYFEHLTKTDIDNINSLARTTKTRLTLSGSRTLVEVVYKDRTYYPVFSRSAKTIVTFLPKESKEVLELLEKTGYENSLRIRIKL
jgi:hypothetical protein